jgi:Fic family protein
MEPLQVSEGRRNERALDDLALEVATSSTAFRSRLPPAILPAMADLVRAMNCYYSNLIEDHQTHPVDIERAMKHELSPDPVKRNLQLEARAHVEVQRWIDGGGMANEATTTDALCEVHRRFCAQLPEELLVVTDPATGRSVEVVPGALRVDDVVVGQHVGISPGAVPRFLERFEHVYGALGRMDTIVAAAAAHHRLLWIHPFADGNGRVARLMSHAMLLDAVDTGAVWSVARGLARNVAAYKQHLADCDGPRRNDLDGRGNLSEEALVAFTEFFLRVCLDQIRFMEGLMQPAQLRQRILAWVQEEARAGRLPPRAEALLEAVLSRGEVVRADVANIVGVVDRHSRRVVAALVDRGVLVSKGPRAPLTLAFPAALAGRWMPGLFPDQGAE